MRHVNRRLAKGTIDRATIDRVGLSIFAEMERNWDTIRAYYQRPVKPVGLEGFLQEMRL